MIAIRQRNKRPFQSIERIRDALNGSISIFANYDIVYDNAWCCCIPQRRSWHALTNHLFSFLYTYSCSIWLFHHFFPLLNPFLPILMQSFVNINLHVSHIYTLIIKRVRKLNKSYNCKLRVR